MSSARADMAGCAVEQRQRRVVGHSTGGGTVGSASYAPSRTNRYGLATPSACTVSPTRRSQTANSPRDHSRPATGPPLRRSRRSPMRSSETPVIQHISAMAAATGSIRIGSANRHASVHPSFSASTPIRFLRSATKARIRNGQVRANGALGESRTRSASAAASSHSPTIDSIVLANQAATHGRLGDRAVISGTLMSSNSAATSSRRCSTSKYVMLLQPPE